MKDMLKNASKINAPKKKKEEDFELSFWVILLLLYGWSAEDRNDLDRRVTRLEAKNEIIEKIITK